MRSRLEQPADSESGLISVSAVIGIAFLALLVYLLLAALDADTDYYGSVATGDFLRSILREGQTRDWRELVKEATGEEMSGKAMLEYYLPLVEWLSQDNAGTKVGF